MKKLIINAFYKSSVVSLLLILTVKLIQFSVRNYFIYSCWFKFEFKKKLYFNKRLMTIQWSYVNMQINLGICERKPLIYYLFV